jgi:hypothetical protein
MDLNVITESNVLKIRLDSGIVLNMQIPKPINIRIGAGGNTWGKIGGDINNQKDLMKKLNKIKKLAKAAL